MNFKAISDYYFSGDELHQRVSSFRYDRLQLIKSLNPVHKKLRDDPALVIHIFPLESFKSDGNPKEIQNLVKLSIPFIGSGSDGPKPCLEGVIKCPSLRDQNDLCHYTLLYRNGCIEAVHCYSKEYNGNELYPNWLLEDIYKFSSSIEELYKSIDLFDSFYISVSLLSFGEIQMKIDRSFRSLSIKGRDFMLSNMYLAKTTSEIKDSTTKAANQILNGFGISVT